MRWFSGTYTPHDLFFYYVFSLDGCQLLLNVIFACFDSTMLVKLHIFNSTFLVRQLPNDAVQIAGKCGPIRDKLSFHI